MKIKILPLLLAILALWYCKSEPKMKVDLSKRSELSEPDTSNNFSNKIGVAAMLSPREALPAYEEIVNYIGKNMNKNLDMLFTKDYATMSELVKKKQVLAAFVCSGPYVKEHDKWGMEILVAPSLHGEAYYYSYLIVNSNSKFENLLDLKNKKFAFTDPESNTGKIVPTYELIKMGKNPEKFFSEIIYTGSHDKSIEAVANNLVDGAAVDNLIWEYLNRSDSSITSRTKIIARFGPFASPPMVTHPDSDPHNKMQITSILLNMHKNPEGKKILDKLAIDKFIIVSDSCYKSVREMEKWIETQKK